MDIFPHLTVSKFSGRKPSFCQYNVLILLHIMKTSPKLSLEKCLVVDLAAEGRFLEVNYFSPWHHFRPAVWTYSVSWPVNTMVSGWKTWFRFRAESEASICACKSVSALGSVQFYIVEIPHSLFAERPTLNFQQKEDLSFSSLHHVDTCSRPAAHPSAKLVYWWLMDRSTIGVWQPAGATMYLLF